MPVVVAVAIEPLVLRVSAPRLPPGLLSVPDDSMRISAPDLMVPAKVNVTLVRV